MVCGQPISGTKAPFAFHLKEISGFAQRQPNLDISNKAHLLPPSPLCSTLSLLHIHLHICMLFEEEAVLIQKPKL